MPPKLSDATATEKILGLYTTLLLSNREWSLTELARQFGCSKPTITRLLEKIAGQEGVKLRSARRPEERNAMYYWLERQPENVERRGLALQGKDVRLLAFYRDIVAPLVPASIARQMDDAIRRAALPLAEAERPKEYAGAAVQAALVGNIDYTPQREILQTLLQAIAEKSVCEIAYTAPGKAKRTHDMAVTSLISGNQALYARGWLVEARGKPEARYPTLLAVHRINEAHLTKRKHKLEAPPDEDGFGIINEEAFTVRTHIAPELAIFMQERNWGPDQTFEADAVVEAGQLVEAGAAGTEATEGAGNAANTPNAENAGATPATPAGGILSFTARSYAEVITWTLSHGSKLRLLEPQCLVEAVQRELRAALKGYE